MRIFIATFSILFASVGFSASNLKVGEKAPDFSLKNQDGKKFDLASRKGKGWTVLFFYPKAGTPGCTTQVCAFRDAIKQVTGKGAAIYGISVDSVEAEKKFYTEHKLSFDLLADEKAEVAIKFQVKMNLLDMASRTTFILDPDLKIAWIEDNVDPALDAKKVADALTMLQNNPKKKI